MTTTQASAVSTTGTTRLPLRLEVVVIPVSDVERAKRFYEGDLGWRLDADASAGDAYRIVQLTPPASEASIIFGTGVTSAQPGSLASLVLVVDDIEATRAELMSSGVEVSEVFHDAGGSLAGGFQVGTDGHAPGRDPEGRSYASYATFADPDGNSWLLQELTERLPGRVEPTGAGRLAHLLRETAEHHGEFEAVTPPHDWEDWYAAYMDARQTGSTEADASAAADRYMANEKGVVATRRRSGSSR